MRVMRMHRVFASALIGQAFLSAAVLAGSANYWFASRYTWEGKQGFFFQFENKAEVATLGLDTLKLVLGVADGQQWGFAFGQGPWQYDRTYAAKAVMGPSSAELWLDGKLCGKIERGLVPFSGRVSTDQPVDWARDPATYGVAIESLSMSSTAGDSFRLTRPADKIPLALRLFQPGTGRSLEWTLEPSAVTTIEVAFRLEKRPDIRTLAPFIDPYGQAVASDWPGKVRSDRDFLEDFVAEKKTLEQLPKIEGYDRFGGYTRAGWQEQASGFYAVACRNGYWWLVTPEGNPCFYVGMDSLPSTVFECTPITDREWLYAWLPPHDGPFRPFWRGAAWGGGDGAEYGCFHTANLIRKYGSNDWEHAAVARADERIRRLGFSGGGKWGSLPNLPVTPVLSHYGVPNLVGHPDVWDPAVQAKFRAELERQIAPQKADPWVLGWSLGNEYDELVTRKETRQVLEKPADVPAKRALMDYGLDALYGGDLAKLGAAWGVSANSRAELYGTAPKPPDGDLERLRLHYERTYFKFVYETVKAIDPRHLYLGFWLAVYWWESEDDWRAIAPYCDVIGYDRYGETFADATLQRLFQETGKPVLCGEFSFPAFYGGERGFGRYGTFVDTDADAGAAYARWVETAARNPWCLGVQWFMYRDQDLTGRGAGKGADLVYGEHYAFGLITVTDRIKWELALPMRQANLAAAGWRLDAAKNKR